MKVTSIGRTRIRSGAPANVRGGSAARPAAAADILAMAALLLSYIWLWQGAFPGDFLLLLAGYFLIGLRGHRRRGESPEDIGLGARHAAPALGDVLRYVAPWGLVPLAVGAAAGTLRTWTGGELAASVAWLLFWALLQQYGLTAFFYRSFKEVGLTAPRASWAAAGMFALFHLPNPFLVPVTLAAGWLACRIYERHPNLYALAFGHALLSLCISSGLPPEWTFGMRVGPGFLRFLHELAAGG